MNKYRILQCVLVFFIMVYLAFVILISKRDWLIYRGRAVCHRTPTDLGLPFQTLRFYNDTTAWLTGSKNSIKDVQEEHLFVFIPGAASAKACSIALARNIVSVNPNADLLMTEHPGVDDSQTPNREDTLELIKDVYKYVRTTHYRKVTFVASCIGLIFLLKAVGCEMNPDRDSLIIVNGFLEWYSQPISLPNYFDRMLGRFLQIVVPVRYQLELDARKEFEIIFRRGIRVICFQSTYNTHVKKDHGRKIRDIIGCDQYFEYPKKIQCYLDMKNEGLVKTLSDFCADVIHSN